MKRKTFDMKTLPIKFLQLIKSKFKDILFIKKMV